MPKAYFSIIATLKMVAMGLATPCPAMSGALPCTGSNTPGLPGRLSDADGSMPSEPVSCAAMSDKIYPNRLVVTSTSNCTDYQARRLNIRYRPSGQKGTRFVHTLNGTAVALSRALIVVMENYQRADGLIDIPHVLKPFMGKDVIGNLDG